MDISARRYETIRYPHAQPTKRLISGALIPTPSNMAAVPAPFFNQYFMYFTYLKAYVDPAIRHISAPLWHHSIPTCPAYIAPHKRRANSNAFQYGGRSGAFF